jgi:hypothetical protein
MPVILQDYVGMSPTMSRILAAIGSCQYLVFSILPIWLIDKLGRRTWMLWGAGGLSFCMVMVCVGFNIDGMPGSILIITMYWLFYDIFAVR